MFSLPLRSNVTIDGLHWLAKRCLILCFFSPGMEAIQLDGDILFGLLKKVAPRVHKHLKTQEIEPILYMTEWFLCLFARTLPWPSVLRIWDMFCCEGVKVLFRVALVLLKNALPRKIRRKCPSMYETLDVLKHLPLSICSEEFLIPEVLRLNISEDDMEKEHRYDTKKTRTLRNKHRSFHKHSECLILELSMTQSVSNFMFNCQACILKCWDQGRDCLKIGW